MDTTGRRTPATAYTGPTPSPARRWAPWLIAACATAALGDAAQLGLNLIERHLQQDIHSGGSVSVSSVHRVLSALHDANRLTLLALIAVAIVGTTWSIMRRSRARVARDGETGVEVALRTVSPVAYWAALVAALAVLVLGLVASSSIHPGATSADFARYRGYLALRAAAGTTLWALWIKVVVSATAVQDRREAAASNVLFR